MNERTEESMGPVEAQSIIDRSRQKVKQSRRWHAFIMLAAGLATSGFFALIGWMPRERWENYEIFLLVIPILIYTWLASIRKKHPTTGSREILRFEMRIANLYTALMIVAVAACLFVLQQGTLPAALIGILPALPCLYGAWRVLR